MTNRALLKSLEAICQKAGAFIREENTRISTRDIEFKGRNDLVSYVDKQAEQMLVSELQKLLPEAGFLTEEGTVVQADEDQTRWIIDPLDGTTNYLHGIPTYAVSVALERAGELQIGVVYEIGQNELFSAARGEGASLNGRTLEVSREKDLAEGLFATGFPYKDFAKLEGFNKTLSYFFRHTRGMRRLGSAATDLAYVAAGRFAGFYEYGLAPWDVAAGILLVQEAGGRISDFSGGDNFLHGGEIIAAADSIFADFQKVILSEL